MPNQTEDSPAGTLDSPVEIDDLTGKEEESGGDGLEVVETVQPPVQLPTQSPKPTQPSPFSTSQSRARASKEDHRRSLRENPGMRKTSAQENPMQKSSRFEPVPEPRYKSFYSDHANPHQRTKALWSYWTLLTDEQKSRLTAYIYRDWPVLIPTPDDSDDYDYIDKIIGNEPIQDDMDLSDKYGAGDYHIYLNQEIPPSEKDKPVVKRTIATAYIRGSRDLKSRPPCDRRISDVNQVSMTDPQNKSYIEFQRMRGILPDQVAQAKKEGEVATLQAVERISNTVEKLTDKVIGMAQDQVTRQTAAQPETGPILETMADAAKRGQEILHDAVNSALELRRQAQDGMGGSGDGKSAIEVALLLLDRINAAKGAGADVSPYIDEIRELRKEIAEANRERMASLERRLEEKEKTAATAANATSAGPFGSIKEGISAFKEMKNLVDSVTDRGGDGESGGGGNMPGWLQGVSSAIPHVSSIVSSARDMLAIWQMGRGVVGGMGGGVQQAQPMPMQPQSAGVGPGPVLVPPQSQSTAIPPTAIPPTAQPIPGVNLPPQVVDLLSSIRVSLLNHLKDSLNDEADGTHFADWFIGGWGEPAFNTVASFGEDQLLQAMYLYPPIAQFLSPTAEDMQDPGGNGEVRFGQARLRKFVHEFITWKPSMAGGGQEDDGGGGESSAGVGGGNGSGNGGAA